MTQKEIVNNLKLAVGDRPYQGSLTYYATQSIEQSKSNYPVSNLIQYCKDMNVQMFVQDGVTLDKFKVSSVLDVHNIISLLMERYEVTFNTIHQKTSVYYTAPKSYEKEKVNKLRSKDKRIKTPLSINTLIAVFQVLHCNLLFE